MTDCSKNRAEGRAVARQADGADVYPPTIPCPSADCYQSITDPARAQSVAFDGKGNTYVSTYDGKLFKLVSLVRRENEPPGPPELIASGLDGGGSFLVYGLALDGKGNAYVVNGARQLWRVPLDGGPPVAAGLDSQATPVGVVVDGEGEYAYVITLNGVLWQVPLHDGGQRKPVATGLGTADGVVLDGGGRNAYVVNRDGVLWRVPLPAPDSDQLGVPEQVGTKIPGGGLGVTLDWAGQNAYVVGDAGILWRVPLDGGVPEKAATGLAIMWKVSLDQEGNAYITEGDSRAIASCVWRVDGVAAPAAAPTIVTPSPGAHTGRTVKFSGYAPGATRVLVEDLQGNVVGSQTVRADTGYWAWALGENVLNVDLAADGVGPVSRRGLPWDPGTHILQFVACNDTGYTAPAPITFTVGG